MNFEEKSKRLIAIMQEVGIDPRKAAKNEMAVQLARQWNAGKIDEVQLMRGLRNLLIFNNTLR